MPTRQGPGWGAVIVVSLIVGLLAGAGGSLLVSRLAAPQATPEVAGRSVSVTVETEKDAIVQTAAQASPAVVTIHATSRVQTPGPLGLPFGSPGTRRSLGSGFFFEHNGKKYVLTNTHVIAGADQVAIRTVEGQEYPAKILGASRQDLAVLDPQGVPADQPVLPLGDSDQVPVGAWVLAIGSPFGIDNTVTVGVVSRKGYTPLGSQLGDRYLIQTDAAINEGNSGGPLIDLGGNVIGVNEMILSPTQTNLGIGFAIPVNEAKELLYFLINRGPWLGIGTQPNSPGLARYFGLSTEKGLVVVHVAPDSPAAKASVQQLDVILQVDAKAVETPEDLGKLILAHKIGDTITLLIQRGSDRQTLEVQAGTIPEGAF